MGCWTMVWRARLQDTAQRYFVGTSLARFQRSCHIHELHPSIPLPFVELIGRRFFLSCCKLQSPVLYWGMFSENKIFGVQRAFDRKVDKIFYFRLNFHLFQENFCWNYKNALKRCETFNRRDRNPCHHQKLLSPPSSLLSWPRQGQQRLKKLFRLISNSNCWILRNLPAPAAATGAPAAGAAPAPDPMFVIKFLTSTPSRALAKRLGQ